MLAAAASDCASSGELESWFRDIPSDTARYRTTRLFSLCQRIADAGGGLGRISRFAVGSVNFHPCCVR
jgi:hypothetical protein